VLNYITIINTETTYTQLHSISH